MEKVYGVPEGMTGEKTSFCAGCTHMLAQKLIVECLNEMGERDNAILSLAIGCSMNSVGVTDIHTIQASHGRSAAVATGISRMNPDKIVLTYQGDGDTMSIGIAESRFSQFMNPVKELCDQTVIAGTFSAGDRHPCNKRQSCGQFL